METQYLQYFVSVAKHLNFNRAAEECNVSQPALSAQIKKFEGILGCQLFYRSTRHVQLTPEGNLLLPKALEILSQMKSIKDLATELNDPMTGTLRIGFSSLISVCRTFCSVKKLEEKYPKLELQFEEDNTLTLFDRLKSGEFDLVMVQYLDQVESDSFHYQIFEEQPLVHIVAKELVDQKKKAQQFISTGSGCPLKPLMEAAARSTGYPFRTRLNAQDLSVIKRLVEIGVGWSIIPDSSLSTEERKGFKITPIKGHTIRFAMVVNRGMRSQSILDAFYKETSKREKQIALVAERKSCKKTTADAPVAVN
jgi:LysR family hydrogen peroxide-inducible transcriptional activator